MTFEAMGEIAQALRDVDFERSPYHLVLPAYMKERHPEVERYYVEAGFTVSYQQPMPLP